MLKVRTYPDPALKSPTQSVEIFDETLGNLLDQMHQTMIREEGIGLAAPQVGQSLRLFVVDLGDYQGEKHRRYEFINPKIVSGKGSVTFQEGCLSLPGVTVPVKRFDQIRVDYQDRQGARRSLEAKDLLAVAIQHEYDHLEGTVLLDHVPFWKRYFLKRKIRPDYRF